MVAITILQHSNVLNTLKNGNTHFLGSESVVGKKGGEKVRKLKCVTEKTKEEQYRVISTDRFIAVFSVIE